MDSPGRKVERKAQQAVGSIKKEILSRAYRVSLELRNTSQIVLRGRGHGRTYPVPYTKRRYRASAPGEVPSKRMGMFRLSWKAHSYSTCGGNTVHASIESRLRVKGGQLLGNILEEGRGMAPRPYKQRILDQTMDKARGVFNEPYMK